MNDQKNRLIELRKILNLSQENFGLKLNMTKSAISKIEKGENDLTDKNIKLICKEFNVNEEWLRTGTGDVFKVDINFLELLGYKINDLDDKDKEIITRYLKLSHSERKVIKEFFFKD